MPIYTGVENEYPVADNRTIIKALEYAIAELRESLIKNRIQSFRDGYKEGCETNGISGFDEYCKDEMEDATIKYEKAIADYNQVIELDPRNANAYNYRGLVNYRLNYFIDAVNDYNNSIDLEPNVASTYYNRGMSYLKLNEKYKACVDFHKACQLKYVNACKMIVIECSNQ